MKILKGDTVKITKPLIQNRGLVGRTGTVTSVDDWNQTCRLDIKWDAPEGSGWETQGVLGSFEFGEIELVESAYEKDQIFKIAAVLHTEPRNADWTWEQCKDNAEILYKAGIRHEG